MQRLFSLVDFMWRGAVGPARAKIAIFSSVECESGVRASRAGNRKGSQCFNQHASDRIVQACHSCIAVGRAEGPLGVKVCWMEALRQFNHLYSQSTFTASDIAEKTKSLNSNEERSQQTLYRKPAWNRVWSINCL